jgi:hypothetical protein
MIRGFELAFRAVTGIGLVMEASIGEGAAETLVEEQEEKSDLQALSGEAVGVSAAIALKQSVAFELAQVVAELVQTVVLGRKIKRGENGLVDLLGGPSTHGRTPVQENLQQADDTNIVEADAGIADRADGDGQGEPLEEREVHMHIQRAGLKTSETVSDDLKLLAYGVEVIQSFP